MDDGAIFVRAGFSCGVIVATLAAIAWAVRRLRGETTIAFRLPWRPGGGGAAASPRRLEVLERLTLGPGSGLAVVRYADRVLVIGLAAGVAPAVLANLDAPAA